MTWLDDYRKRLRAASSLAPTQTSPMGQSAADIAANIIATNYKPSAPVGGGGSSDANNFWDLAKNFESATGLGGRALDVLSRGTYASANPNYQAAKRGETTLAGAFFKSLVDPAGSQDHWGNLSSPIDDIKAIGSGLAGKDKITYSDVLKEEGMGEGPGRAIAGFGLDVLADPLTFIPATWFAKGYGAVGKGISKATPDAVKKTVVPTSKTSTKTEVLTTEDKLSKDFINHGSVEVNESISDDFINTMLQKQRENIDPSEHFTPRVDSGIEIKPQAALPAGELQNYSTFRQQPEGQFVASESGVQNFVPEGGLGKRDFATYAMINQADELLSQIPHTRKTKDMFGDRLVRMVDDTETIVKRPEKVSPEIIYKELKSAPATRKLLVPESYTGTVAKGTKGRQATKKDIGKWVASARTPAERFQRGQILEESYDMSAARLVEKNQTNPEIVETIVRGQRPEYARARLAKGPGLAKWREEMRLNGFTAEEIKGLNQRANLGEAAYNNYLAKINTKRQGRFTLDELEAALKDGRVAKEDLQPLFDQFQVKTIKGLKTKFNRLMDRGAATSAKNAPSTQMEGGFQFGEWVDSEGLSKSFSQRARERSIETSPADPWHDVSAEAATLPTAGEFVEAAKRTGDQVIEQNLAELGEASATAVRANLKNIVDKEFLKPRLWTKSSNSGTKRTHANPGDGWGRNIEGYNARSQYTASKGLLKELNRSHTDWFSMSGLARSEEYLSALKVQEDTLRAYNINPILGQGKTGNPLSLHDIFQELGPEFVAKHYIDVNTALPVTHLTSMVDDLLTFHMRTQSGDPITVGMIRDTLMKQAKAPLQLPKRTPDGALVYKTNAKGKRVLDKKTIQNNFMKTARAATKGQPPVNGVSALDRYIADELLNPLLNALPQFNRSVEKNLANIGLKVGESTKYITDEVVQKFANDLRAGEAASVVARVADPKPDIATAAKEIAADNIPGIGIRARDVLETSISDFIDSPNLYAVAKGADAHAGVLTGTSRLPRGRAGTATLVKKHTEINHKIAANTKQKYDDIVESMRQEVTTFDVGQEIELNYAARIAGAFNAHVLNKDLRPFFLDENITSQSIARQYSRGLGTINAKHSPEDIRAAFKMVQTGQTEGISPQMQEVVAEVNKAVKVFMDTGDNAKYDLLHRRGITAVELNKEFELKGMPKDFRFENNDLSGWQNWTVDDPLDMLSRFQNSVQSVITKQEVGMSFGREFGSPTNKPGWVKLTNKGNRESVLFDYIDTDNLYFPKDIAEQLSYLDTRFAEMMKPTSKSKTLKYYDTVLHALKSGYTIYRPGHHVRNGVGDTWLNQMDGVYSIVPYKNALHVMGASKGRYKDWDSTKALMEMGETGGVDIGKTVATVKINGKKVPITAGRALNMMQKSGARPDYSIIEDLTFNAPTAGAEGAARAVGSGAEDASIFSKVKERAISPTGGRIKKAAVATAEGQTHFFRTAHFLHALKDAKPRTHFSNGKKMTEAEVLDDLATQAARRVRKFHPDGSDLTKFEGEVMRRSFLFYSWMRKSTPLVMEMLFTRPGRFMMYPKAMYNMAEGMGIDLQSMGNPFPEDQMFPDFLKGVQGPVMGNASDGYYGLKMGTPGVDTLDEFFTSPQKTGENLLNSIVPFPRVPIEFGAGHKVGGIPITDKSDYLGGQIPNVSYIDKLSNAAVGRTVSSGFTDAKYESPANEGYESSGNPSFVNWLLGIGLTDMSKPSYIKSAQFDERDRARRENG